MVRRTRTYGDRAGVLEHWSFFRRALHDRARPVPDGLDPVEEYLIDQANLRGYHGAFSSRDDLGERDARLADEEIIIGLLQPHAPADLRVVKLIVRMLQKGDVDPHRLSFLAKRERAWFSLAWLLDNVPAEEQIGAIPELIDRVRREPPRERRRPDIRYSPQRLLRRSA